ncbi:MAG TPA: hypothetical protein VJN18_27390 [Polyangiaceae bacterium]|nr:hypothetical protein [Polyangiaceae bacterium]
MSAHRARLPSLLLPLALALLSGCTEAEVVAKLPSLQGSEDALFVCRDADGQGHPFSDCPDRDATDDDEASQALSVYALVSQTVTNEVAIVDVSGGHVVDVDPSSPGYGFLRVGGRPVAMAASPGGRASFVATADVGRNGIFALGTQCLDAPPSNQHQRDLTSWPACRLDSAPGEIAVLVEPPPDGTQVTSTCDGEPQGEDPPPGDDYECGANLQTEAGPVGRRKLVVSLPERGELMVIDAQWLIDQPPGTFPDCVPDKTVLLDVIVPPSMAQRLPEDLVVDPLVCSEASIPTPPPPSRRAPRPAGFGLTEGRLYVADEAAPVIHVLDTSSPCNLSELPSLLPMSLREPERVVTTRRVAVSPLTPSGKQFVYAIDAEDQPGASVMAFDVSPPPVDPRQPAAPNDPTPIVRPGSPELPNEKPDRLALGSSAKDVIFAYRDLPYVDPETGVGAFGTLCDPTPSISENSPAGLARPNLDFTSGARPGLLRGLFGFILLTNGTVAIVDVEDFDAPCRRPVQPNAEATPDFRGCAADPGGIGFFTESGEADDPLRTVTGEVSCRVVEPHRFRAGSLAINDPEVGVRAPSLRGFPQLSLPTSAATILPEDRPRLLGVPFVGLDGQKVDADVFVGSTRYNTGQDADEPLPVDPNSRQSEQLQALNSVVLPPLQPRAYAPDDTVSLTYEGAYMGSGTAGFLRPADGSGEDRLEDVSLSFCAAGVYDETAMQGLAREQLGLVEEADLTAFGLEHSDYVQITSELLGRDDIYWQKKAGALGYQDCLSMFGPGDAETLDPRRDFHIQQAFADHLVLRPSSPEVSFSDAVECFPTANRYRLRSGRHWVLVHGSTAFNHDIVSSGDSRQCVRSCSPLKKWSKTRVFEISSRTCRRPKAEGDPLDQRVGCSAKGEVACVFDQSQDPGVQIGGDAAGCIFDGLTERFALYRGRQPSVRDSTFTWQTTGGFSPLIMSLANVSETVSPQSLQFLQEPELMAVVDGAGLGLSLLSLDTFSVVKPSPFY